MPVRRSAWPPAVRWPGSEGEARRMNDAIMFCAIAAMVALLTAGLWFGLANWLRAGPKTRSLLSVLFGQMIFGAALLVDGAPYNGVIFALFR